MFITSEISSNRRANSTRRLRLDRIKSKNNSFVRMSELYGFELEVISKNHMTCHIFSHSSLEVLFLDNFMGRSSIHFNILLENQIYK